MVSVQVASGTAIQAGSSSEDVEAFAQTFSVLLMSCMALALFLVGTGLFMAVIQQVRGVETSIFLTLGYGGPMDLAKRVQEVSGEEDDAAVASAGMPEDESKLSEEEPEDPPTPMENVKIEL
eukprot:g32731.t1